MCFVKFVTQLTVTCVSTVIVFVTDTLVLQLTITTCNVGVPALSMLLLLLGFMINTVFTPTVKMTGTLNVSLLPVSVSN